MQEPRGEVQHLHYITFEVRADAETAMPDIRLGGSIEGTVRGMGNVPQGVQDMPYATAVPIVLGKGGKVLSPDQAVRLYVPAPWGIPRPPALKPGGAVDVFLFAMAGYALGVYPEGARIPVALLDAPTGFIQPDGRFRILGVPAGQYRVQTGWTLERGSFVGGPGVPVDVPNGRAAQADLALEPGGTLSGRLLGPGGKAVGPSLVWTSRRGTLERAGGAFAREDGSFTLKGLAPGQYVAAAWHPGLSALRRRFAVRRAGETASLDLQLEPGVALRGRVAGKLPEKLFVSVESENGFGGAAVAGDGSFAIEHLLPGTYTLRLWADGQARIVTQAGVQVKGTVTVAVNLEWR